MKRLVLLLAALGVAMAIVVLVVLGDGLLTENQRADAQTISRPNFVFVMTDDLDEHSMEDLTGLRQLMGVCRFDPARADRARAQRHSV